MQDILNVNSKVKHDEDRTNNLEQGQSFNMMQQQILGMHKDKIIEGLSGKETTKKCNLDYCNTYTDLQKAFCGGKDCVTDAHSDRCYLHWVQFGKKEGRKPNPDLCARAVQPTVLGKISKDEKRVMDWKKSVYDNNLSYLNANLNTYINELNVLKVEGEYDDIDGYKSGMQAKYDRLAGLKNNSDYSSQYIEGPARDLGNDIKRKEAQKKDLNVNLQNTKGELSKKFGYLKGDRERLRVLQQKGDALDGELDNVELTGNSLHLRYMAWMISAVTMFGIAAHQMSK